MKIDSIFRKHGTMCVKSVKSNHTSLQIPFNS